MCKSTSLNSVNKSQQASSSPNIMVSNNNTQSGEDDRPISLKKRSRSLKNMSKTISEIRIDKETGARRHVKLKSDMFGNKPSSPHLELEINGDVGGLVGSLVKFELKLRYSNGSMAEVPPSKLQVLLDGPSAGTKPQIIVKGSGLFQVELYHWLQASILFQFTLIKN